MVKLGLVIGALGAFTSSAFAPVVNIPRTVTAQLNAARVPLVDATGNNIAIKELLNSVESTRLLSKVAEAGLLSRAQRAGISLAKLEPFLKIAAENRNVLVLLEAGGPEILLLVPKLVDFAPPVLPLLARAVEVPPAALSAAAFASLAFAAGTVYVVPDDTILEVAAQTLVFGTFGLGIPAALLIGAELLKRLTK